MMAIDELLIDFDEMGFVPTTLCENPDEYARDWKKQLLIEIKRLKSENKQLKTECTLLDDELRNARQETINVLNKLKENIKIAIDTYFNKNGGGYYLAEDVINDIDELLKEYEE